jgi:hypothetical protein
MDPDPKIRASDQWIRIRILLFSSLAFKQGWKRPGFFFKSPAQWVFLGFFYGFFGFFWVFGFFWFFLVFLPGREGFRVSSVSQILLGASRL